MPAIKDKVVVVTGSTRGYGYALAESLLEAGAAVAVTGRTCQAVDRVLLQQVGPWAAGAFGALVMACVFPYVYVKIYNHPVVFTLKQESAPVRVTAGAQP